jgi:TPR repeat protein
MYKLGVIQLNGLLSQNKNPREAITWLKRAAAQADTENPHALHELGLIYERNVIPSIIADEAYARELFTQAAQLGYAPSQFKMGCCYEYGQLTCPVDPRRSIAWYTKAAEQGDAESELSLSGWYLTGAENMLKQSDTEAYLWARRAADKGLAKAEYAIGYYAEMGIGVRLDLEEARRWYLRAAAQGNKRAMLRLTEMKNGTLSSGSGKRPVQSGKRPAKDDACVLM